MSISAGEHPHRELIDGLRQLADFIEQHEDSVTNNETVDVISVQPITEVVGRHYGLLTKDADDTFFRLRKRFGKRVSIRWIQGRENVCKRVQVGTKVIPATPATVVEIPAQPEKVVPLFEWECPDSLREEVLS